MVLHPATFTYKTVENRTLDCPGKKPFVFISTQSVLVYVNRIF